MNDFLRRIALLSLVRMAAEMLLPDGKCRSLCDMLLGLIVMLNMLYALRGLLGWAA